MPITGYCAGAGLDPDWDDGRLDGHPGAPGRLQAPVDRRRGPGAHPQREHRRGHGQRERLPGLREREQLGTFQSAATMHVVKSF